MDIIIHHTLIIPMDQIQQEAHKDWEARVSEGLEKQRRPRSKTSKSWAARAKKPKS